MKFSRNPSSGELECYTDDGVYLGVMSTMGDNLESGEKTGAEDGGPLPDDEEDDSEEETDQQ